MNAMEPLENAILTLSQKGFCCSQILALLILGAQGRENPDLVRSLAGCATASARAETPAAFLPEAAAYFPIWWGRTPRTAWPCPEAKIVQEEFVDWFRAACEEKWGSIHCADIIGEDNPEGPDKSRCRELLAQSWTRLLGILTMHNIAFAALNGKRGGTI